MLHCLTREIISRTSSDPQPFVKNVLTYSLKNTNTQVSARNNPRTPAVSISALFKGYSLELESTYRVQDLYPRPFCLQSERTVYTHNTRCRRRHQFSKTGEEVEKEKNRPLRYASRTPHQLLSGHKKVALEAAHFECCTWRKAFKTDAPSTSFFSTASRSLNYQFSEMVLV